MRKDISKYFHIDTKARIEDSLFEFPNRVRLSKIQKCVVGAFSDIGAGTAFANVAVGRYCSIGSNVKILSQHPVDYLTTHKLTYSDDYRTGSYRRLDFPNYKNTVIGNDVWIGSDVNIKSGVTIGCGSIIGASSVVTCNVDPFSVVGGVPAKEIKKRFSRTVINELMNLKWWNYDIYDLKLNFNDVSRCIADLKKLIETGEVVPHYTATFMPVTCKDGKCTVKQNYVSEKDLPQTFQNMIAKFR